MSTGTILPLQLDDLAFEAVGKRLIDGITLTLGGGPRTIILGPNGGSNIWHFCTRDARSALCAPATASTHRIGPVGTERTRRFAWPRRAVLQFAPGG